MSDGMEGLKSSLNVLYLQIFEPYQQLQKAILIRLLMRGKQAMEKRDAAASAIPVIKSIFYLSRFSLLLLLLAMALVGQGQQIASIPGPILCHSLAPETLAGSSTVPSPYRWVGKTW